MAKVNEGRWTAEIEGDFVVFLIGARPNSVLQLLRSFGDLGGRRGMTHMLKYLSEQPEKGLLGFQMGFPTIVQYWRSFEHLEAFARDADDPPPRAMAELLASRRQVRPDRHLARDVSGARRRVRVDLREHAADRSRQGGHVAAGRVEHGTPSVASRRVGRSGGDRLGGWLPSMSCG
jgi:hypothetical protein